jgi:glucokinase
MVRCVIALDVGGTSIKAALVEETGRIREDSVHNFSSMAKESKETIVSNFMDIVRVQALPLETSHSITGIAMAFPGPFDYAEGISLMQGLDKYDAIYELNLCLELHRRIGEDARLLSCFEAGWRIVFENDVRAFALGQVLAGSAPANGRALCLTIGTGLGSAFLDSGNVVTDGDHIPSQGWLYDQPFLDGILDDYISRRGILNIARELGFAKGRFDVKELAELARQGDRKAAKVFDRFGVLFAAALKPYVLSFRPEAVIIGGQMAKSCDLFIDAFKSSLPQGFKIVPVENTSNSAFLGAASQLINRTEASE